MCVKQVFSIREEWFKSIFTPELTVFPIFPPPTLAIELLAQFEELVVEDPRPDSTLRATVFPLCLQGFFFSLKTLARMSTTHTEDEWQAVEDNLKALSIVSQ